MYQICSWDLGTQRYYGKGVRWSEKHEQSDDQAGYKLTRSLSRLSEPLYLEVKQREHILSLVIPHCAEKLSLRQAQQDKVEHESQSGNCGGCLQPTVWYTVNLTCLKSVTARVSRSV